MNTLIILLLILILIIFILTFTDIISIETMEKIL